MAAGKDDLEETPLTANTKANTLSVKPELYPTPVAVQGLLNTVKNVQRHGIVVWPNIRLYSLFAVIFYSIGWYDREFSTALYQSYRRSLDLDMENEYNRVGEGSSKMKIKLENKTYYDIPELIKILGVCKATLYNWIRAGKLKTYKLGRRYLVSD
ncbi:MAG: helix-turn-helix domain-containing protein, partial [Desulfatiglandales bacterium]